MGVLMALFALSQVFLALPAGRYADRHGLHRPVKLAVVLAVLGNVLAAAWPLFATLCVAALLTGAASGLTVIALQRHVGQLANDGAELRKVFSWLAIGPAISNFLGPFFAGLLIDANGFRAAFVMLAALPLITWTAVSGVVEHPKLQGADLKADSSAWDLLRDKPFRHLMIINWMLSSCWDVHTFLVPVMGHERMLSATVIGVILGSFAIAATVVRLLMPWWSAHLREWQVVDMAMVSTAVLFGLYPLVEAAWWMLLLSVLLGFALGSVQPMIMSALHQMTPRHRHGEALGLRAMTINASSVLMPMMFGSAGAVMGATGVFWVVGLMVGGGSWMARAMDRLEHSRR